MYSELKSNYDRESGREKSRGIDKRDRGSSDQQKKKKSLSSKTIIHRAFEVDQKCIRLSEVKSPSRLYG